MGGAKLLVLAVFGLFSSYTQANTPVEVDVYYESMCPDSASFFSNQLAPTYEKLSDYMTLNLIPYGNAHYRGNPDEYTFTCQHGSEECYGNIVQTCYIELVNNTESSIKFINCAFNTRIQRKTVEKCIKDSELRPLIKKCAAGSLGKNLEYEMAKKTDALQPPHNFIPWITVNGKGSTDINNKANANLMGVVCEEIPDPKPDSCLKNRMNYFKRFRNYSL